eukprot:TRINITY_DN3705_c0_g1_i1.p1 TRINITY_DN3705_c0_g1~~TRINITY_DN3705_c0_g1_i1.p1  ORF type:complete len:298 (-),score=48.71 TRINITY_DN3705_c0_g1_i1:22-915(-)
MEESLQFDDNDDLIQRTNGFDFDYKESEEEFDGHSEGESEDDRSGDPLFPFVGSFRSKGNIGGFDNDEHFSEFSEWSKRSNTTRRWQDFHKGYDTDSDAELHEFGRYDTDGSDTEALNVSYSTPDSSTFAAFFNKLTDKEDRENKERLRQKYKKQRPLVEEQSGSEEEDDDDSSEGSDEDSLSDSESENSDSDSDSDSDSGSDGDETPKEVKQEDFGDEQEPAAFSVEKLLEQETKEYEEKRKRRNNRLIGALTPRLIDLKVATAPSLRSSFSFEAIKLSTLVELFLITSDMLLLLQ